MDIHFSNFRLLLAGIALISGLLGCTPRYDWRDVRGVNAPYTVLMPAKPASHSRPVNIGGTEVTMTMTGAEVDDVMFVVGTAELPDAKQSTTALNAMKTALVGNINGTIVQEKSAPITSPAGLAIDFEAVGPPASGRNGGSRVLIARLIAIDQRVYQALVLGPEESLSREAAETFFSSFKPQ